MRVLSYLALPVLASVLALTGCRKPETAPEAPPPTPQVTVAQVLESRG